jgi:hypothetical protein
MGLFGIGYARVISYLTNLFRFLSSTSQMPGYCIESDHSHFLPHPFQFVIYYFILPFERHVLLDDGNVVK